MDSDASRGGFKFMDGFGKQFKPFLYRDFNGKKANNPELLKEYRRHYLQISAWI